MATPLLAELQMVHAKFAERNDLTPEEMSQLLEELNRPDVPPRTEPEVATLRRHGIDRAQFRTLQLKDGGKAYRELMQKRSADDGGGRAA